jgi:hypothetical protein
MITPPEATGDPFAAGSVGTWDSGLVLEGCIPAGRFLQVLDRRTFLHAGPPLDGAELPASLASAISMGCRLEGESMDQETVAGAYRRGHITLLSGHEYGIIGPLTGVVSASTPVWVVRDQAGSAAASPVHEGPGLSMRAGNCASEVLARLRWLGEEFAPTVDAAIRAGTVIRPLTVLARALHRGDEGHNRNVAGSAELLRLLAAGIAAAAPSQSAASRVLTDLAENNQASLPVGMAAAKVMTDHVLEHGPRGLVVTAGSNGIDFGIRVSGTDGRWFRAPGDVQQVAVRLGNEPADPAPLIGDSLVMEVVGLGVAALTAAPRLAATLGVTATAPELVRDAYRTAYSVSCRFHNPGEAGRPTPSGIDLRKVVEVGRPPTFTVGYLANKFGAGRVGVGLYEAPLAAFAAAQQALADQRSEVGSP